jgi:hypothetical protein
MDNADAINGATIKVAMMTSASTQRRCDTACDGDESLLDEGSCRNVQCDVVFPVGYAHLVIKAQPLLCSPF